MVQNIIGAKKVGLATVYTVVVDESGEGQRLDNFLLKQLKGVPKSHIYQLIRSGQVRVNRGRAQAETRLSLADQVRVPPVRVAEKKHTQPFLARAFAPVFEDEVLLVIHKPAGVAVHGGSGVSSGVIEQLRSARPQAPFLELVHRLDKETSGLLVIAKKRSALVALQAQFKNRQTGKLYAAIVAGAWPVNVKVLNGDLYKFLTPEGERRVRVVAPDHEGARRSITLVRVVQNVGAFTLLEVTIKTGRTHQIRVHLAHAGHPILGDDKYGNFALNKALAAGKTVPGQRLEGMFLHAQRLRFEHPVHGQTIELEAPWPPLFQRLLDHA